MQTCTEIITELKALKPVISRVYYTWIYTDRLSVNYKLQKRWQNLSGFLCGNRQTVLISGLPYARLQTTSQKTLIFKSSDDVSTAQNCCGKINSFQQDHMFVVEETLFMAHLVQNVFICFCLLLT